MKKKLDKKYEARREGVLLEDLDSKLDLVLEGHSGLDKKIDNLRGEMNERFKEVDYKFEVVFEQLHLIRNEKISRDEFVALEKKVLMLERKFIDKK